MQYVGYVTLFVKGDVNCQDFVVMMTVDISDLSLFINELLIEVFIGVQEQDQGKIWWSKGRLSLKLGNYEKFKLTGHENSRQFN